MSPFHHSIVWLTLIFSVFSHSSRGQDALPRVAEKFELGGHTAFLYAAPRPAAGRPWLWYAPTLKGVSLAGRKVYFESFLRAGISIAGMNGPNAPPGQGIGKSKVKKPSTTMARTHNHCPVDKATGNPL